MVDRLDAPRRIHIIGGAGSGKTTTAVPLAADLGLPYCPLDDVAFEGVERRTRPMDQRLADIRRIVAQPAWVTEGAFLWWTDDVLEAADAIIWLDPPWYRAVWRLFRRNLGQARERDIRRSPWRIIRGCVRFELYLAWAVFYYCAPKPASPSARNDDWANRRAGAAQQLKPYAAKVLHWRTCHDAARFLSDWAALRVAAIGQNVTIDHKEVVSGIAAGERTT